MGRASAFPEHIKLMSKPSGAGVRVLVVDDYPDTAKSMAVLLRLHGHEVDVAMDGKAAVEQAKRKPPDVVLLDVSMPGINGYEVARQLRAMFKDKVRLVAITAHSFEEDRQRCWAAGFDRHLVKPADPNDVLSLLREC